MDLCQSVQLIFDRIFDGDDLAVIRVEDSHDAVERRGFTGSGRSDDENHTVRHVEQRFQFLSCVVEKTDFVQIEDALVFLQQTENDTFAVHAGDGGNTDVQRIAGRVQFDTTILREAAFRDVHAREQLNTRCDGGVLVFRRAENGLQQTVDTETDGDFCFGRFDMDIGRAHFLCAVEDIGNETDDRGFFGEISQSLFGI